ncbi:hypothetical protein [Kribbella deserti]|uniref:DUF2530 domain-containing protein n=1 Tax=Kribbella deserti TaxID=1926257 RepID=A0ABV6QWQ2_9ACTN
MSTTRAEVVFFVVVLAASLTFTVWSLIDGDVKAGVIIFVAGSLTSAARLYLYFRQRRVQPSR